MAVYIAKKRVFRHYKGNQNNKVLVVPQNYEIWQLAYTGSITSGKKTKTIYICG